VKRITVFAASCLVAMNIAAAPSLIPGRVEQVIRDRVASGVNPTIVVAVVDGDKSAIYAFGKLDTGATPTDATVYEIGSVTKTFTATLLADAVIKGQLRLDQPLSTLLPGFTIPSLDNKVITLANVAEQNSGLPPLPTNLNPADPDPYADYDVVKLQQFLASYKLPRAPGASYEYSNLAVGVLGYALGQHAGSGYPALVNRMIFEPLHMKNSYVPDSKAGTSGSAGGHDLTGKAVPGWYFDALTAAGGIRSTGADMLHYLQANMGLLASPLWPAMQLAQVPRASTTMPDNRIGLIWMTLHKDGGPDIIWHNGMTSGYASYIGFTADRKHGIVILTNAQLPVDDLGFASLRTDWPLAPPPKTITMSATELSAYQGVYQLDPKTAFTVTVSKGALMVKLADQPSLHVYAHAKDHFFYRVVDAQLDFERDGAGKVVALVLHQDGRTMRAPKAGG
jgi:serine-type D-Ala-D-Ala carboxypeptidase/endopeptidase